MKIHKLLLIFCATISFGSCTDDINGLDTKNNNLIEQTDKDIVIFERNPQLPSAKTNNIIPANSRATSTNRGNDDGLLGYGYKLLNGTFIMGDLRNVSFPVIDLEAIRNYDPSYISGTRLNTTETKIFAYDTYDRYKYNSTTTKKVSSGFSINLKVFSIGRKKSTTEVFKTVIDSLEEATYGELSLDFVSDHFSLQHSDGIRKLYSRQFLTKSFVRSLYGSTIQSTLDNYGEFVMTDYLTGGKAYAIYAGHNKKVSNTNEREKGMEKSINASLTYKGATGSGELGFSDSEQKSENKDFQSKDTYIYIKTFGGDRRTCEAEVKARTMEDLNVDLSPWLRSLTNEDNNTIIDVSDNSLFPLSDFVLEKNFKQRLDDTTNGVLTPFYNFVTPYIVIERVLVKTNSAYESLYTVAPVLITRQGDRIIFMDSKSESDEELAKNDDNSYFLQKVRNISANRSQMFSDQLELDYNKKARINPMLRNPLCIVINDFNKSDFYQYYYAKTGIQYIYNPKTHIAFSFYVDEDDDEVLDVYGIRDWVENLPEKRVTISSLANHYNIIGL